MMDTLEELNEYVTENYGCNYRVIFGHGKYALIDDDSELTIPLIISENPDDLKDYLKEFCDED
jgi:uncharacterized protein YutD